MSIPQKLYKKIQELIPIACVDIIIKKGEKFLLVKRKNKPAKGQWFFVGGRIMKGELLEEAALRKVKEETGLDIILKKIIGVDQTIFKKGPFDNGVHTINIVFLAEVKGKDEVNLDSQSVDYKWFRQIDNNWHPYIRKFLKLTGFK